MSDRWSVYRGYGVRDTISGGKAWCYDADQRQNSVLAHEIAASLNASEEDMEARFCGCGDELDHRLGAACADCQARTPSPPYEPGFETRWVVDEFGNPVWRPIWTESLATAWIEGNDCRDAERDLVVLLTEKREIESTPLGQMSKRRLRRRVKELRRAKRKADEQTIAVTKQRDAARAELSRLNAGIDAITRALETDQ